jgi:hypothetical protein
MTFIADILLVAAALGAGIYCFILASRLKKFNDLEKGVGGAVAVLSAQVDDLSATLISARNLSKVTNSDMRGLIEQAEKVAQRLELMMASMHDMPDIDARQEEPASSEAVRGESEKPTRQEQSVPIFLRHDRHQMGAG